MPTVRPVPATTARRKKEATMTTYTVALADDTVGTITAEAVSVGDTVTVTLHDENGMPIQATGEVVEILEEDWMPPTTIQTRAT